MRKAPENEVQHTSAPLNFREKCNRKRISIVATIYYIQKFIPASHKGFNQMPHNVALVPDRFAHYRYPVFKLLSNEKVNGFRLIIFADIEEVKLGIKLADKSFSDMNYNNGGIRWIRIRNFYYRRICFWQSGLLKLSLNPSFDTIIYWGEAHRISTWISVFFARLLKKKVMFWTHGLYGNEGLIKRFIRIHFYRLADAILLYGNHGRSLLEPVLKGHCRLYVIKNSLDYESQNSIYKELSDERIHNVKRQYFSDGDKVICFIGRLEPRKKLESVVRAVEALKRKYYMPVKLLFIGDGSDRLRLEKLVELLGLCNDVLFFGACYDDRIIIPLLAMVDILVSPGQIGLTAMHSLISGTPVIAHGDLSNQMPEAEAIKNGINGLYFKKDDEQDLVEKIKLCLDLLTKGAMSPDECRNIILNEYTPAYQLNIFKTALKDIWNG